MTDPEAPAPRADVWWTVAVGAVVILPLLVAAVLLATGHAAYRPGFDNALIELRVRDVTSHVLYTGPHSRFGWYHPGPMLFYLLALPYHLTGASSISIPVTALVLNAVVVGVALWVAFRIGRLAGALWVALPLMLLMRSLGIGLLHSAWNPDIAIFAFFAFLVAAWAVAAGDRVMILVAVVLGSFVVQSHVGDALPVVLVLALAIAFCEGWRPRNPGRALAVYGTAALVVVGLWILPLYGDLVAGNGNLRKVAAFAFSGGTSSHEARAGGLEALKVVGAQWGPRPLWLVTSTADLPFQGSLVYEESRWWLPLGVLPAAGLAVWACVRRRRTVVTLAAIVGVGYATAIFSMASVRGAVWSYLAWWIWVVGAMTGVLTLAGLWAVLGPCALRYARPALLGLTVAVGVVVGVGLVRDLADDRVPSDTTGLTVAQQQGEARAIGDGVVAAVRGAGSGPVVLDTTYGVLESPGLALALDRAGVPVRIVGREASIPYGPDRQWKCEPARAVLHVYSGDDNIRKAKPTGRRIARWIEKYTPAERRQQRFTQSVFRSRPDSIERTRNLDKLRRQLNGPKYIVEVYDRGPADEPCRR